MVESLKYHQKFAKPPGRLASHALIAAPKATTPANSDSKSHNAESQEPAMAGASATSPRGFGGVERLVLKASKEIPF